MNADLVLASDARSIAIADGAIVAIGTRAALAGITAARTIELGARVLAPGFIDAHAHLLFHSIFARQLDARCAIDAPLDEILARISAAATNGAAWLRAWGFAPYRVRERRAPTIAELDRACPARPLALLHVGGHTAQLNTAGLRALAIDSPSGVLHERAMQPFSLGAMARELLAAPIEDQIETIANGAASFAALGITTTCDAMTSPEHIALYREVARRGRLPLNVVAMPFRDWTSELPEPGGDRVRAGAVKLFADGSLSGCTAAVSEPYAGTHDHGILHHTQDEVDALVRALDGCGRQIAIHAIGDRAIAQALRALAPVTRGGNPRRHRLEHVGIVTPAIADELARQQIVIATQPRMLFEQGDAFARACPDRIDRIYPYRTLIERGLCVAGSSDCPVVSPDPILGMRAAILRETEEGRVLAPSERLDARAALRMWTEHAAYSLFMERERGAIEVGLAADLVVLSPDESIVDETYVAGERVFSRAS